jgi:hypothetical protein
MHFAAAAQVLLRFGMQLSTPSSSLQPFLRKTRVGSLAKKKLKADC